MVNKHELVAYIRLLLAEVPYISAIITYGELELAVNTGIQA